MSANSLRLSVGGRTDIGAHRSANEDHLLVDLALGLFVVFDGGGSWRDDPSQVGPRSAPIIQRIVRAGFFAEPHKLIEQAFRAAGDDLAKPDEQLFSDGGSVALAFLREGEVHVSWLGDSMVHRVSTDKLEAITWAHTFRNFKLREGTLTEEFAARPLANVLMNHLGGGLPPPVEVISFTPNAGDRLILTTDGVHDVLDASAILAACQTHSEPQSCVNRLIELARERGSRDNCTCVAIAFE